MLHIDYSSYHIHKTNLNSKFFNPSSWFCAWTDDACDSAGFEPLGGLWIQGGGNQQCWCGRTQHAIQARSNQISRYPPNLLFLFIVNESFPLGKCNLTVWLVSLSVSAPCDVTHFRPVVPCQYLHYSHAKEVKTLQYQHWACAVLQSGSFFMIN